MFDTSTVIITSLSPPPKLRKFSRNQLSEWIFEWRIIKFNRHKLNYQSLFNWCDTLSRHNIQKIQYFVMFNQLLPLPIFFFSHPLLSAVLSKVILKMCNIKLLKKEIRSKSNYCGRLLTKRKSTRKLLSSSKRKNGWENTKKNLIIATSQS